MTQFISLFQAAIMFGSVIMFGALGEILTERSGNLNLGVPGIMYLGGIAGLIGSFFYEASTTSPSPVVGMLIALVCAFGMAALGEAHTEAELEILLNCPEIPLLGINARDLRTFETDLERTDQLIQMIPRDLFPIAESAIRSHEDIARLQGIGAAGFLIGETLMRAEHPGEKLRELIG